MQPGLKQMRMDISKKLFCDRFTDFLKGKIIRINLCSLWLMVMVLSVVSCKKSELSNTQLDFRNVKVYDDNLASAENVNVHVNSGKARLYMSYGRGSTVWSIYNWSGFQSQDAISGVVMATDLKGNLIWRNELPKGYANVCPVELEDESCLIACTDMYDYEPTIPNDKIYLFHYDKNGTLLKSDSLVLPTSDFYTGGLFSHLNLLSLSGSDALIYGTYTSNDWLTWKGYMAKYNANTGAQWFKPVDYIRPDDTIGTCIYNGIKSNDGNLVFIGAYGIRMYADSIYVRNIIVKTTPGGDIIWKKQFDKLADDHNANSVSPTNIIQVADGSYYFCTNDAPYTNGNALDLKGLIYHLNSAGDSINAISINQKRNSYCSGIIENGSGIEGIFNKYPDYIYNNFETYYKSFNTELYSFDYSLNLVGAENLEAYRTDFITSLCKTSDGHAAFFGLTSSYDHLYYKPILIIKN